MIREPYVQWAEGHISRIRNVLNDARAEHTGVVKQRIDSVGQMKDVVSLTKGLFALSKVSYPSKQNKKKTSSILHHFLFYLFYIYIPNHDRKLPNWNQRTTSSSKRLPLPQSSSPSLTAGCAMNSRWKNANKPTLPRPSSTRSSRRSRMRGFKRTYWLTQSQK